MKRYSVQLKIFCADEKIFCADEKHCADERVSVQAKRYYKDEKVISVGRVSSTGRNILCREMIFCKNEGALLI